MEKESSINRLLTKWMNDPSISDNIVTHHIEPEHSASLLPIPSEIHPTIINALYKEGIKSLYSHQVKAWEAVQDKKNIAIVTGTASGKTLCYNLPILNTVVSDNQSCALYLFPTKALAADQLENLKKFIGLFQDQLEISAEVYDGDTIANRRSAIRGAVNLLLTNPDMLHSGILPHHTLWAKYFKHLSYIVVDEIHIYRGIFGSNVANVIRRLRRIAQFYGAYPIFIMTSATIANPGELANRLVGETVTVIDEDGSPKGERHFILYNPPVINQELGIRGSPISECLRLAEDLLILNIQSGLFSRTRRTVEILLRSIRSKFEKYANQVHGYRSGYLSQERRAIERSLRLGDTRLVATTNALELGIDIGSLDVVIMVGYPGSVASTRQQTGRAGRRQGNSLVVLIAGAGPLDQFLMKHPEYLLTNSPERALINPDNLIILLHHLKCAAFELPIQIEDNFGSVCKDMIKSLLEVLEQNNFVHRTEKEYFWIADEYPAANLSLRSLSTENVILLCEQDGREITIGQVDKPSAFWMVHPNAIYLHEGQSYLVKEFNTDNNIVKLIPHESDYYTEPKRQVNIEKISTIQEKIVNDGKVGFGEILVTSTTTGYRRVHWTTREVLGTEELVLPTTTLRTMGCWILIEQAIIDILKEMNLWSGDHNIYGKNWDKQRQLARERDHYTCQICGVLEKEKAHDVHHKIAFRNFKDSLQANQLENLITLCPSCHKRAEMTIKMRSGLAGLSNVVHNIATLFLMCDTGDLGTLAEPKLSMGVQQAEIMIFEQVPAGIGLSDEIFRNFDEIIDRAYELVLGCECKDGCPSCIGPSGENGTGGKQESLALLSILNGKYLKK